jgi:hypothetical protein
MGMTLRSMVGFLAAIGGERNETLPQPPRKSKNAREMRALKRTRGAAAVRSPPTKLPPPAFEKCRRQVRGIINLPEGYVLMTSHGSHL